jgi:hypothetical protein
MQYTPTEFVRNLAGTGSIVRISDWLAAAAFFISLAALLSNLILVWLKWPRIVVEVAVRDLAQSGDVFLLTVINNGSEPVTVKTVGLTQSGRGAHRLDYLDTWRGRATLQLPVVHGIADILLMPLRVDAHSCHVFEYAESALSDLTPGVPYHGFAARYRGVRWLPNHPLVRETRSRQTVIRSA